MGKKNFEDLIQRTAESRRLDSTATHAMHNRIVSQMVATARRETDRLEHHLLELPLSVIIYQWVILRLKARPWQLLVPISFALSFLLQGILTRVNLWQFLSH